MDDLPIPDGCDMDFTISKDDVLEKYFPTPKPGCEMEFRDPDDGWNDVRAWMYELGIPENFDDPVWAVALPLFRHLSDEDIEAKLGPARTDALHERADDELRELQERIRRRKMWHLPKRGGTAP